MQQKSDDSYPPPPLTPEYFQMFSDDLTDLLSAIDSKSNHNNAALLSAQFIEKMKKDDEIQSLFNKIIDNYSLFIIYQKKQQILSVETSFSSKNLSISLSEESVWHFLFMNYLNEENENLYMERLYLPESTEKTYYSMMPSTYQDTTFFRAFNSPFGAKVLSKSIDDFEKTILDIMRNDCVFNFIYHPDLAKVIFNEQRIKKNADKFKNIALSDVSTMKSHCAEFYSAPLFFSSPDQVENRIHSKSLEIVRFYPELSEFIIRQMFEHHPDRGFMNAYMSSKIHDHFWLWSGDFVWTFTQNRMTWEEIQNTCLFFENENVGYEFIVHSPEETYSKIAYLKNELLAAHAEHRNSSEFEKCIKALDKISTYMALSPQDLTALETFLWQNALEFKDNQMEDYKYQPFQSKAIQAFNLWLPELNNMDENKRALFDKLLLFTAYHSPGTLYPHSEQLMGWIQETSLENKRKLQKIFLTHLILGDSERLFTGMIYKSAITWDAWTYRPGFADYLFTPDLFPEVESARHPFLKLSADVFNKINLWEEYIQQQKAICSQKRPDSIRTLPYLLSYRAQWANALHLPHTVKNTKEPETKPTSSINRF